MGIALRVLAAGLFASMLVAALHDVSKAWDVWYYHLPFAARIAGIVDAHAFAFSPTNQARFDGFPLLAETLQGLAWRALGRPEAANLVSFAALPALAWLLRRDHGVPPHLTFLALVAVPLVQIHATAAYVDLFANALCAVLVLSAFRMIARDEAPSARRMVALGLVAAAAANSKFQIVPIVLLACAVVVSWALWKSDARARLVHLAIALAALPLVMATPLKNALRHGNPVWPIELHVLGRALPSLEGAYASSPVWLEGVPRPVRFLASVLELGARPIAEGRRWSIDQWAPPDHPAYRMGGYFGAYVVVVVAAIALSLARKRTREAKVAAGFAAGLTAVVSVLPQSHELRYYLVWMLVMVALAVILWWREAELRASLVATAALLVVAVSTEGTYLWASGDRFATLVASKVDPALVSTFRAGERACVAREPWTFLYAPTFHRGASWTVQEALSADECAPKPPLRIAAPQPPSGR